MLRLGRLIAKLTTDRRVLNLDEMKDTVKAVFGDTEFTTTLTHLLDHELVELSYGDYHTWVYGDITDDEWDENTKPFFYFIHKGLVRSYKDLDFIRTRWELDTGLNLGDTITIKKDGTSGRDVNGLIEESITVDDTGTISDALTNTSQIDTEQTSETNNTRTDNTQTVTEDRSISSSTTDGTNTAKSQGENSPLGSTLGDITTPYEKTIGTNENLVNVDGSSTNDGTITNTGTVENDGTGRVDTTSTQSTTSSNTKTLDTKQERVRNESKTDNVDEEYIDNAVATRKYGIEELAAIKTSGVNIMKIVEDIMDTIVYEFNTLI